MSSTGQQPILTTKQGAEPAVAATSKQTTTTTTTTTENYQQQHKQQQEDQQRNQSIVTSTSSRPAQLTVKENIGVGPQVNDSQLEELTSSFRGELDYLKRQIRPNEGIQSQVAPSIGNRTSAPAKNPKAGPKATTSRATKAFRENLSNHQDCIEANHDDEGQRLIPEPSACCCPPPPPPPPPAPSSSSLLSSKEPSQPPINGRCCHRNCICIGKQACLARSSAIAAAASDNNNNITNNNNNINNEINNDNMATKGQTVKLIPAYFVAELIGTFLLVVIGDGVIGAYVLTGRKIDIFPACFAFGVGAMIASFASGKISGAHINPAASLAFALDGRLKWKLLPIYLLAQYLGGFLAALILFLNYSEAINSLDGGQHSAFGAANSTGGIFATYPANWVSIWGSLLDQIVGTAVLLFSISAVTDRQNSGLEERHQPLIVAFVIGLICVAFSPNCGAIFNPARDLPPRLVTAIFGYGPAVWEPLSGTYWLLAGVLGPHIGAIIGVFAYKWLIGASLAAKARHSPPSSSSSPSPVGHCPLDVEQKQRLSSFNRGHHQMAEYGAATGAR